MATATLPAHLRWRGQLVLIGVLLGLSLTAWLVTSARMRGMDDGPGTALASVGFFVTAWVVMMAAMMFPSIAPMVLTYRTIQRGRRRAGRSEPTAATSAFIAGYLVAWTAFGLAAYALFELVSSLSLDALAWDRGGRYLAGAVIVAAAVYQLTPAKDACLRRCRGPLTFLTEEWRDGLGGALRMGISHGFWCVGCCWALMASLFALGVMSMTWMLFIAALISAEKLLPWRAVANRGIAVLLLALGLAVAAAPDHVPGLVSPGSMTTDSGGMKAQMTGE
jgi:predicted metal-binding membrane protein